MLNSKKYIVDGCINIYSYASNEIKSEKDNRFGDIDRMKSVLKLIKQHIEVYGELK